MFQLELRESCESTNTALLDAPAAAAGVLQLLACEDQTAGRGRRGRSWMSWGPGSLTFSVRWQFCARGAAPAGLSLAAGVAVARSLEDFGAHGIALKWPNDILCDGAKLGGILTELATGAGGAMYAVIGIGLNLRRVPVAAVDAPVSSLDQALPTLPERSLLLGRLAADLAGMLQVFSDQGFSAFREDWARRNHHAGRLVRIDGEQGTPREGVCLGVDDDGALLLEEHGRRRRVLSGDVTLRSA